MTEVSETIVAQRIRNRIMENLDYVSTLSNVAKYGAFENISSWFDWVSIPLDKELFKPPIFVKAELDSLERITKYYDAACNETKTDIFDEETLKTLNCWVELELISQIGHALFMQRGKFSEETKAFDV